MSITEQVNGDWQARRFARYTGYPADIQGTTAGAVANGLISGNTTPVNADLSAGACLQLCAGSTLGSIAKNATTPTNLDPNDGEAVGQPIAGWRTPVVFVAEDIDAYKLEKLNNEAGVVANLRDGGLVPVVSGIQTCKVLAKGSFYAGQTLMEPVTGQFYLQPCSAPSQVVGATLADSSAVTSTSTETVFSTAVTIAKNTLNAGDMLLITGKVIVTAANSTDTLTIKGYLGSAGTTSDAIFMTTVAVDVAAAGSGNDDVGVFAAWVTIRSIGTAGTATAGALQFVGTRGQISAATTEVATGSSDLTNTTIAVNTTTANIVSISATWSTTSASNSCKLAQLTVTRFGASSMGLGPVAVAMETPSSQPTSTAALVKVKLLTPPA